MMRHLKMLIPAVSLLVSTAALGHAVFGKIVHLKQPDGTAVEAKVYGDEFHHWVESLDGFTLLQDPQTKRVVFAKLSDDQQSFVSSGITYSPAAALSKQLGIAKHLRLPPAVARQKIDRARLAINQDTVLSVARQQTVSGAKLGLAAAAATVAAPPVQGNVTGLTLLVDFADDPATVAADSIDRALNQPGYAALAPAGSLYDYYKFASGGALSLSQRINATYYRAAHPKAYYNDVNVPFAQRAQELVTEAITNLKAAGFDFRSLTANTQGMVIVVNILYAGSADTAWATGLWPHAGGVPTAIYVDNQHYVKNYVISDIGSTFGIATIAHETGHMLMGWPDTYDYGNDSAGTGIFDLMGYGAGLGNVIPLPNPYLRNVVTRWGTVTDINGVISPNVSILAGGVGSLRYRTANTNELFLIENIDASIPRFFGYPGSGLLIWHIDTFGNQNAQGRGPNPNDHYAYAVVQADGQFNLETFANYGDANDFFRADNNPTFSAASTPPSSLWSGADSGLAMDGISNAAPTMSFLLAGRALQLPVVQSTLPKINASGVDLGTQIVVTFDTAVYPGDAFRGITLTKVDDGTSVPLSNQWLNGATLYLSPSARLRAGTTYRVNLPASAVYNVYGTTFPGYSFAFSTLSVDTIPPTVTGTTPLPGDVVDLNGGKVQIVFSEPIAKGPAFAQITLAGSTKGINSAIAGSVLTMQLAATNLGCIACTLVLPAGAVTDLAGNPLAQPYKMLLYAKARGGLKVVASQPLANATAVDIHTQLGLSFNTKIMIQSAAGITLGGASNGFVASTSGTNLVITPTPALKVATSYRLVVAPGAVASSDGIGLTSAYKLSFATKKSAKAASEALRLAGDEDGTDGEAAATLTKARVTMVAQPPGSSECPDGGILIGSCQLSSADGSCADGAAQAQSLLCLNSRDLANGQTAQLRLTRLVPGSALCAYGGWDVQGRLTTRAAGEGPANDAHDLHEVHCDDARLAGEMTARVGKVVAKVTVLSAGDHHCPAGGRLVELYTSRSAEGDYHPGSDDQYHHQFVCSGGGEDFRVEDSLPGQCEGGTGKMLSMFRVAAPNQVVSTALSCPDALNAVPPSFVMAIGPLPPQEKACTGAGISVTTCGQTAPHATCLPEHPGFHQMALCADESRRIVAMPLVAPRQEALCQGGEGIQVFDMPRGGGASVQELMPYGGVLASMVCETRP